MTRRLYLYGCILVVLSLWVGCSPPEESYDVLLPEPGEYTGILSIKDQSSQRAQMTISEDLQRLSLRAVVTDTPEVSSELMDKIISAQGLRFRIREIHPPVGPPPPMNSRLLPTVPELEERYGPWGQEEAP